MSIPTPPIATLRPPELRRSSTFWLSSPCSHFMSVSFGLLVDQACCPLSGKRLYLSFEMTKQFGRKTLLWERGQAPNSMDEVDSFAGTFLTWCWAQEDG